MIEVLPESQGKVIGVKIGGKLTAREYEEVIIPRVEAILREHDKARFLWLVADNFEGAEAGAVWDDTKFGLKHRHDFEKLALVGGPKWMDWLTRLVTKIMSGETKTFPREQLQEAWDWIKA
jgi:hypothetical protein